MDINTLNSEIVLCRGAVKKAKVAVIRKLIRKTKILKSCKKENVKEKNLKKAEGLIKRIEIMKKAKEDEVTKFGLRHADLEKFIKRSKIDLRQNALARLAKHDAVKKKVNAIREKIPNWEVELPLLLNSLGKKKKKKLGQKEGEKKDSKRVEVKASDKIRKEKKLMRQKTKTEKLPKIIKTEDNEVLKEPTITKIDDPFFMGKKMIAPKLLSESNESNSWKGEEENDRFNKNNTGFMFNSKPFKVKRDSWSSSKIQKHQPESEEMLHPSWAAKKIKLIKPFEGKKIKFSDE